MSDSVNTEVKVLELKINALLQRMGEMTQNYENAIADLRVALSNAGDVNQTLTEALAANASPVEVDSP